MSEILKFFQGGPRGGQIYRYLQQIRGGPLLFLCSFVLFCAQGGSPITPVQCDYTSSMCDRPQIQGYNVHIISRVLKEYKRVQKSIKEYKKVQKSSQKSTKEYERV